MSKTSVWVPNPFIKRKKVYSFPADYLTTKQVARVDKFQKKYQKVKEGIDQIKAEVLALQALRQAADQDWDSLVSIDDAEEVYGRGEQ